MPTRARKKRETYHHGDLSNALVAAALEVIAKEEQLTLREVSRRVGVNHRAVYRHFADLTALLAAVAEQGYRQLLVALEDALASAKKAPPEKRMEALACAYVAFAIDHPAHYRIMFGRRLNEDGRFNVLEDLVLKAFTIIDTEVAAGIESGKFVSRPRRELVFAFWSLAHGFASLTLVRRIKVKRVLVDPYVRQIVAPFIAGLRAL
ncbi:MAG: TetR/AcrR family transcriptional regulator [Archangium sp.]|nr:TetR/AcrR family transcriptional regulator [Archangium sp.]